MTSIEETLRQGLAATAILIPDEKPLTVAGTRPRRQKAWILHAGSAAVVVLAIGLATFFVASQVGKLGIPQGPCEVLWSELAGAADPVAVGAQANLPTDLNVPADFIGSTMYCAAVTEGTIEGPGVITGMAITDSSHTEVWVVLGVGGHHSDWEEILDTYGFENLRRTEYGLTNTDPRTPEVNFWVKAAESSMAVRAIR